MGRPMAGRARRWAADAVGSTTTVGRVPGLGDADRLPTAHDLDPVDPAEPLAVEPIWSGPAATRIYAAYLALQAGVGLGLWVAYASSNRVRAGFELLASHPAVTDSFVLADLLVAVLGSALSAWALASDRSWAVPVVAFTAGGMAYPTFYLVAWQAFTKTGTASLAIMLLPALITAWIAVATWRSWRARP